MIAPSSSYRSPSSSRAAAIWRVWIGQARFALRVRRRVPAPAWLILPTYNEAENLEAIVRASLDVMPRALPPTATGSSSSTTARPTAPATSPTASPPSCPTRSRSCTAHEAPASGSAYLAGFRRALEAGAGYVLRDGRRLLPRPRRPRPALRVAQDDADLALGSRYVAGGEVEAGACCGGSSRAGAAGTRGTCSACPCATSPAASSASGARCSRRIELDTVRSQGYAFQVELTYRAVRNGFRVSRFPSSSATAKWVRARCRRASPLEAVWRVPQMRFHAR